MLTIRGRYTVDDNFTTIFSDNKIYTIARATGEWGSVTVDGYFLTQEMYDKWESECQHEGTFELEL